MLVQLYITCQEKVRHTSSSLLLVFLSLFSFLTPLLSRPMIIYKIRRLGLHGVTAFLNPHTISVVASIQILVRKIPQTVGYEVVPNATTTDFKMQASHGTQASKQPECGWREETAPWTDTDPDICETWLTVTKTRTCLSCLELGEMPPRRSGPLGV